MKKSNKPNISVNKKTGNLQPPKKDATDTCNARRGDTYCKQPAGSGTDHPGEGRCKFHGGCSTGPKKAQFAASEFLNQSILKKFESISSEDPTAPANMDNEINVLRTYFYEHLKKCIDENKNPTVDTIKKYTDALVKVILAKHLIESKVTKEKVPTQIIVMYVNQIVKIIDDCVPDSIIRKVIARRMREVQLADDSG